MPRIPVPGAAALLVGLALSGVGSHARAEPPIRSVEDAVCRLEARARVFTEPNPHGLELEVIGRRIYGACMRKSQKPAAKGIGRRRLRRP